MNMLATQSVASMVRAYVGVGSNLADPRSQVMQAITELDGIPGCCCIEHSSLYRSRPMGPQDQPDFINAVAALDVALTALRLLEELQRIENRHGRSRSGPRWGPRTLDLDLLTYGDTIIASETLTVPHPGLLQRDFVLWPLYEIAPGLQVPGHGPLAGYVEASRRGGSDDGTTVLYDGPHA